MTEAPFVPFYTSDFLAGTSGMTAACKGVYITLLCLMYEGEAPLQQSWETLARRCGCTLPAFRRAVESLQDDGKLTVSEHGIWSEKCDKHIAQRRERQSSAKAAAKKRWQKNQEKQCKPDATASNPQCKPEPDPYIREEPKGSLVISPDPVHANDLSEAVAIYNTAAEHAGWPKVAKMTPQRTKSLRARMKDCGGIEGWRDALRKAYASDFIRNDWAGFNFDSLISQQKFTGLMEGKYDNRTNNRKGASQGCQNRPDAALEQIARLAGLGKA